MTKSTPSSPNPSLISSSSLPSDTSPASRREGHCRGYGGCELFFQSWSRSSNNETLVITHGIAEHSECYAPTAEALVQLGWNVVAWDLRGHGRSEGKRGYVADFADYARDLGEILKFFESSDRIKKDFALIGHSMGGLVSLRYLLDETLNTEETPKPRALALSSPLLGIGLAVPVLKDLGAKFLRRTFPTLTLHNEIRYDQLSRDTERLKDYGNDPLRHDKIAPGLYLGMLEAMEFVKQRAELLLTPCLLQAAGQEKIVSLPAIREFFPMIGSKEKRLIVYDQSYHEIFNDLDRAEVFRDLNSFLESQLRV